ncbi:hypothetical protein [Acetobacter okinawensis]|uniref:Uncharacterized protein n=1 Tax=Acetobacter okinawensis TaxID=1076594 RepID=A0A252BXZ3_9PROT|nr:hypothetical protein [Acetobacter okinawensis]OUJ13824.1 hypothetical protein HK26_04030 [Acetobacter okinawensis]
MQDAVEYAWFDDGRGRATYRRVPSERAARSDLPCPMLITDTIDETQSMADGQFYTSKRALRRTYRADGNPQGKEYIEVGNDQKPREQKRGNYVRDKNKARDSVDRAIAAVDRGEGIQA